MRRIFYLVLPVLAFLALTPSKSSSQGEPSSSNGGLIATRNPDDGVPAARTLLQPQVLPIQRWLISWAIAMQPRPVARVAAVKARPAAAGRGHAGTP
jgi:hypothetical protein